MPTKKVTAQKPEKATGQAPFANDAGQEAGYYGEVPDHEDYTVKASGNAGGTYKVASVKTVDEESHDG